MQELAQVEELLRVATSREQCGELMDSRNKATCRWADEEKKVGHDKG